MTPDSEITATLDKKGPIKHLSGHGFYLRGQVTASGLIITLISAGIHLSPSEKIVFAGINAIIGQSRRRDKKHIQLLKLWYS